MPPATPPQTRFDEFDPLACARDQKHRFGLRVDASTTLPVLLARGRRPGPTLVVSAGVHGDEYEGVRAIFEFFEELDTAAMAGDLLAAPIVNPPAFHSGTRVSPVDRKNLARLFPGDANGTLSDQIAWQFAHCILARADFYLDLHSGGVRFLMPSMAGYNAADPRGAAAAKIFGAPVIWAHDDINPGRTISCAHERGIPWLYTEARGAGRIAADDLLMMKRGIRNLLMHLGIVSGVPECFPEALRLQGSGNTDAGIPATHSGFLITAVDLLERVAGGQLLGRLVDNYGQTLEEYRAPENGIVGLIHAFPVVERGATLFLIARERT